MKASCLLLLLSFFCGVFAHAQSLTTDDLKAGEIYYAEFEMGIYAWLTQGDGVSSDRWSWHSSSAIFKVRENGVFPSGDGSLVKGYWQNGGVGNLRNVKNIRLANKDEIHWFNICKEENKHYSKEEALKMVSSKNRGPIISAEISLNRKALWPKVKDEGWQFSFVPFRYQFVNCGGEVQVGVQYDRKAEYISYLRNGVAYFSDNAPELWPKPNQIEVGSVQAKLYYGNTYWGEVSLTYIVGNFAGCFGETFDVLKQVNKDPTAREYRENLDKFSLKNIAITEGGVTIKYQQEHEIIKKISYDDFGNPKSSGTKTTPTPSDKPKYDMFGNPTKD